MSSGLWGGGDFGVSAIAIGLGGPCLRFAVHPVNIMMIVAANLDVGSC